MLRTMEERAARQRALKQLMEEQWDGEFLTLAECARRMKMSPSTARRIFRHEPGVEVVLTPGSRRPIIRVPRSVFERVMRRSANPWMV